MRTAALLASLTLLAALPAHAEMRHFTAHLTGASETPPNDSKGQGMVDATFDPASRTLAWTIDFSDLSGPATAAHFHGPAPAGKAAGPVVPIKGDIVSPLKGTAQLTDAQAKELIDGLVYFNVHTAAHKDGELRGQLEKAM
jgi:hypothetical protein